MGKPKISFKTLFRERLYFLMEVLIVFLGIFLAMLIPYYLVPYFIPPSSMFLEPIHYTVRAISAVFGIIIFLYFANFIMESQKRKLILEEDINPAKNFMKLFSISKKNFKYQILYGVLILFLVFIPLDYVTYLLVPDMLEYSKVALNPAGEISYNSYLLLEYFPFLLSVIIIQIFVSVYEESLTRGFLTNRGAEYLNKMSAVMIASFFFGLGHYEYLFTESTLGFSPIYPFIWFLETFLVGIILSMIVLRKRWIFPVIFAHAINNIISAHAIWNYLNGHDFLLMSIFVYIPCLIVSIVLFIWQFSRIKEGLEIGFNEFKSYFKNDEKNGETTSNKFIRIILDFLFGLIIFLIGVIII